MNAAVDDLLGGWRRRSLWLLLAWDDIRLKYRRSVLGPLWITLATGFFITVISILWTEIMNREARVFVPWFAIGFTLWQMMAAVVTEGASVFSRNSGVINNIPLPLSVHVYRAIATHLMNYGHNFAIVLIVLAIFQVEVTIYTFLFVPGLVIMAATAVCASLVLGMLGARYRDLSYSIAMMMAPMFFLTPVLWMPDMLGGARAVIADFNPFTHYLAVVREPLLGRAPDLLNYSVTIGIAALLALFALHLLSRHRGKVPYWVL